MQNNKSEIVGYQGNMDNREDLRSGVCSYGGSGYTVQDYVAVSAHTSAESCEQTEKCVLCIVSVASTLLKTTKLLISVSAIQSASRRMRSFAEFWTTMFRHKQGPILSTSRLWIWARKKLSPSIPRIPAVC